MEALVRNRHTGREILIAAIGRRCAIEGCRLRGGVDVQRDRDARGNAASPSSPTPSPAFPTAGPSANTSTSAGPRRLMLDLDHFSANDEHGHLEGDRVLAPRRRPRAAVRTDSSRAGGGISSCSVKWAPAGSGIAEKRWAALLRRARIRHRQRRRGRSQSCGVSSETVSLRTGALYRAKRGGATG